MSLLKKKEKEKTLEISKTDLYSVTCLFVCNLGKLKGIFLSEKKKEKKRNPTHHNETKTKLMSLEHKAIRRLRNLKPLYLRISILIMDLRNQIKQYLKYNFMNKSVKSF